MQKTEINTLCIITGIVALTILEIVNIVTSHIDGVLFSGVIGAIVYLVTGKYYKIKYGR